MRLYLIRHGKTMANEQHLYCGSTDIGLSEQGMEELKKIHYDVPEGCRFLTSGMKRTAQTLQILFGDVPYETDQRFREMDFGDFEMESYESLKNREDYQTWISGDNEANLCPGGESGQGMRRRVLEGLFALMESMQKGPADGSGPEAETDTGTEPEATVLVAHGGTIAVIMEKLFPDEGKNRYEWQPRPGCGYLIKDSGYEKLQKN